MWLGNFQVVQADGIRPSGSVRIEDGFIAEIVTYPVPSPDLDGGGMLLLPGFVDLHGDMIEREVEPRPGAAFPLVMAVTELDKRYAACGVTTAFVAVSFSEDTRSMAGVRSEEFAQKIIGKVRELKPSLLTEMRVHARFEVNNERAAPVLKDLVARHAVDLVSLTDHTPGQGQYRDIERYIRYVAKKKGLSEADVAARAQSRMATRASRPHTWDIVREVTDLAREKRLPIASHDDDSLEKVALMQELGACISEFPVDLEAAKEARRRGMRTVMGAPNALRGLSNAGNLSAREALKAGALDVLASDYHAGALLRAALAFEAEGLKPLHEAIAFISSAPAEAVGLKDRGAIAVGSRADLVLVDRNPVPRIRGTMREGRFIYAEAPILERFKLPSVLQSDPGFQNSRDYHAYDRPAE